MNKISINTDANDILSRHGSNELKKQIEKYVIKTSTTLKDTSTNYDNKLSNILDKIVDCLPKIEFSDILLAEYTQST